MSARRTLSLLIALAIGSLTTSQASAWPPTKVAVRGTSDDTWRGYPRGDSFVGLTSVTFGLLGYERDALSGWSAWLDVESATPLDRRHEQGRFDELRTRVAVEGPADPNISAFFGGAALSYDVSDALDAHGPRAAEWSLRGGWHVEDEPMLPFTFRAGVDRFMDAIHGMRIHGEGVALLPIPSMSTQLSVLAAWSDYPEPGLRSRPLTLNDLSARLDAEHTLARGITIDSGLFAVHGARRNMPTSSIGVFVGARYGTRLSRAFDAWGM